MARASSSGACAGWHAKTLRAIVMLLGRVIPVEVNDTRDIPVEVAYRSVGEGASSTAVLQRIMHQPAEVIDHEGIEIVEGRGSRRRRRCSPA